MPETTLITGGTIVTVSESLRADLLIEGESIAAILTDSSSIRPDHQIDATGLMVLPGGIDVHTHFREPDPNSFEGFLTGGAAAAAGGITTVVEMPQGGPTTHTAAQFAEKIEIIGKNTMIDFALWGGVVGGPERDVDDIAGMAALGAAGFKSFMASSSPSFPAVDGAKLYWAMQVIAETGIPYGLHAEDDVMLASGLKRMQDAGRTDPLAHAESRPPMVEVVAVDAALYLAEKTGCPLYICHCASADALRLIVEARERGVDVTVETCPQYLALNTDDLQALHGFARCAPAFREQSEVDRIWEYVIDGTIDVISSDHSAFLAEAKAAGEQNIFDAPNGLSGVQTLLPVLWDTAVNQHGLPASRVAQLLGSGPARIFGLDDRKGSISIGKDADLVLLDPDITWTVRGDEMLHRQKWTPFEGKQVRGQVARTIRRGETLFERSTPAQVLGQPGSGCYLPRKQ